MNKAEKKPGIPRQYSFVRPVKLAYTPKYPDRNPFSESDTLVFFGEIPNMPGHCIVSNKDTGIFYYGYHTDNFEEIPEAEL